MQSVEPPAAKASKETQCTSDMQLLQPDSQPEIQSQISGDLDSPRTVPVAAESDWLSLPYGIQDLVLLEKFHLDLVGAGLFMLPQRIMKVSRHKVASYVLLCALLFACNFCTMLNMLLLAAAGEKKASEQPQ